MSQIIIFHGKHGDDIYDASTPELKRAAMLDQLRVRADYNWYGKLEPFEATYTYTHYTDEERAILAMDEDAIQALPPVAAKPLIEVRARDAKRRKSHEAGQERIRTIAMLLALPVEEAINHSTTEEWVTSKGEARTRTEYTVEAIIDETAGSEYEAYEVVSARLAPTAQAEVDALYDGSKWGRKRWSPEAQES